MGLLHGWRKLKLCHKLWSYGEFQSQRLKPDVRAMLNTEVDPDLVLKLSANNIQEVGFGS